MHIPTRLEDLAQQLNKDPKSYKLVVEELYRIAAWIRKSDPENEFAPRLKKNAS